jgi:AraC-like DNA-binding protein
MDRPVASSAAGQVPTLAVAALTPVRAQLAASAVDVEAFFATFGLGAGELDDPDNRIALPRVAGLWQRASEAARDQHFGLHAAAILETDTFGVLSYLTVVAPTLRVSMRSLTAYFRLVTDGASYALAEGPKVSRLEALPRGGTWPGAQLEDFMVAAPFLYTRRHLSQPLEAMDISFMHRLEGDATPYREVFGATPAFGANSSGYTFPSRLLDAPAQSADSTLAKILERVAANQVQALPDAEDLEQHVKREVMRRLSAGMPSLEEIAALLGLSSRSLQRKLRERNTQYSALVDEARADLAKHLLCQKCRTLAEVAFLTAFSEPSAFHRAFKRWTGQTPDQFRREHNVWL